MILTTKTSYAVRALIGVALLHSSGAPVSIKTIASEEGISDIYLEQIFNRLKRKGIVKSIRGSKGGYVLSRSPEDITVYDIVMALEESIAPSKCADGCLRAPKCAPKDMWDEVEVKMRSLLEGYTLKELLDRTLEKNPCRWGKVKLFERTI